jgi:hypothetical protein
MAHESHFAPVISGSADQHDAQQEAFRARHGSSRSQTTHEACRTIRAVSRPKMESAVNTAGIVRVSRLAARASEFLRAADREARTTKEKTIEYDGFATYSEPHEENRIAAGISASSSDAGVRTDV